MNPRKVEKGAQMDIYAVLEKLLFERLSLPVESTRGRGDGLGELSWIGSESELAYRVRRSSCIRWAA